MHHIAISGDQAVEPGMLSLLQELSVAQLRPTQRRSHSDLMAPESTCELPGKVVVKQNAQAAAWRRYRPRERQSARYAGRSSR